VATPHHPTEVLMIEGDNGAAAVLHPLRRRILETLRTPDSASGLARQLGIPRQKINYHLRELEKARLVELVEERRKGNCIERIVCATALSYVISPRTLGALAADPREVQDRFSSTYLMALAAQALQELGTLRSRADEAGKRLASLALQTEVRFADAAARQAFADELTTAVARLVSKYHDESAEDGRAFRFLLAGYPALVETEPDDEPTGDDTSNTERDRTH
jgi:DNA-binding transcriptional ArsR family regulator